MIEVRDINLVRLEAFTGQLPRVLGITMQQANFYSAGMLCKELTIKSPPSNLAKSGKKADAQIKKNFYYTPRPGGKFFTGDQAYGNEKTTWLYASPLVIVGTKNENIHYQTDTDQLLKLNIAGLKLGGKARWAQQPEKHRRQHVMMVNKPVIKKSQAKSLRRKIVEQFGKLKAAWAVGWEELRVTGAIPAWIKRHIPEMKSRGCRIIPSADAYNPSITIIASAKGVESDMELKIIRGALKSRAAKMKKDIQLYLQGIKRPEDFRKQMNFKQVDSFTE